MGITFREVLEEAGGMSPGSELKAFLPGGASTSFMPPSLADLPMDYRILSKNRQPPGDRGHHGV